MALKPNKQHIPALDTLQVLKARELYYLENWTYQRIADDFGVSRRSVEKAVQGVGRFYSGIEDNISDHTKKHRVQLRQKYNMRTLRSMYKSTDMVETADGTRRRMPRYNHMNDWTEEQKARAKESERIRYERAKKFGF